MPSPVGMVKSLDFITKAMSIAVGGFKTGEWQ